ncbi:J domain-containing protein [Pedobacter sp. MC2016-15]|uniref:J domain-containing protein n=1 Tax=Pedobacter sp. MC2016-15 TaxID=2994473 RepID=UPI002247655E|nr:J domain-containing protein [Pedobacter sp. MC2016-15]MCX2479357.1 J domain-containing protein [Pedobacter sp. MC2016-15]
MKWFGNCTTLDQIKGLYKSLAKQYHPDLGGDTITMQEINKEYAFATARIIDQNNLSEEDTESEIQNSEEYRIAILAIVHFEDITIEVVGSWIWVTGSTYHHRADLKAAGYLFAPKKRAWYFRTGEHKVFKGGRKSLDEIREKYGSEVIKTKRYRKIF